MPKVMLQQYHYTPYPTKANIKFADSPINSAVPTEKKQAEKRDAVPIPLSPQKGYPLPIPTSSKKDNALPIPLSPQKGNPLPIPLSSREGNSLPTRVVPIQKPTPVENHSAPSTQPPTEPATHHINHNPSGLRLVQPSNTDEPKRVTLINIKNGKRKSFTLESENTIRVNANVLAPVFCYS